MAAATDALLLRLGEICDAHKLVAEELLGAIAGREPRAPAPLG